MGMQMKIHENFEKALNSRMSDEGLTLCKFKINEPLKFYRFVVSDGEASVCFAFSFDKKNDLDRITYHVRKELFVQRVERAILLSAESYREDVGLMIDSIGYLLVQIEERRVGSGVKIGSILRKVNEIRLPLSPGEGKHVLCVIIPYSPRR